MTQMTREEKIVRYEISDHGDMDAGILPYGDVVTVTIQSGNPGGEEGDFEEALRLHLAEWFDTPNVYITRPEPSPEMTRGAKPQLLHLIKELIEYRENGITEDTQSRLNVIRALAEDYIPRPEPSPEAERAYNKLNFLIKYDVAESGKDDYMEWLDTLAQAAGIKTDGGNEDG